ncbi:MAG: ABC transporter ATP-binding protein [Rhodospirillales bacterium]|jgi:putative spermidine/putrescine transport system ATP-binding protein
MTARGATLVIGGLTKSYGSQVALHPTELSISPGEFFSLIGPSGSGKSTLLGCIAGFLEPSGGRIQVDGRDIGAVPPYRRNIGMVFQNYALFPHMTVFENVAFPLRLRRIPAADLRARVHRMLDTVRLSAFADRSPAQLSGGQQQRVALARAAVYDPQVLLMDEPLGALDKNLREEMQHEIRRFHAALGTTIVYVTHDQDEAATMSDRIAIMRDGRIVQVGPPRALYENPCNAFVAGFLGEANLFDVRSLRHVSGAGVVAITADGLEIPALGAGPEASGGQGLAVCIRPEAISIAARDGASGGIAGRVEDVIFTAGAIRYRVAAGAARLVVRRPLERNARQLAIGDEVVLSHLPEDTLIIRKE